MRRPRTLSAAERALWQTAMQDAAPIARHGHRTEAVPVTPAIAPSPSSAVASSPPVPKPPDAANPTAPLDRRTAARLRRGRLAIDARIDLHGMTQATAHAALDNFVARQAASGARTLLVITGKGVRRGPEALPAAEPAMGILRREVPRWLAEAPNRPLVLAIREAAPQHGGGGALYVLLRRRRGD